MTSPPGNGALNSAATARDVLLREARALESVAGRLGESFDRAAEAMEACRGRVIVAGVGKSGLVGAKIAATLTSTGTLSFFLHPTDALHGDLGIVTPDDILLALSKSGRSAELLGLIPHVRRLGAGVIAVTAAPDSPLAAEAGIVIDTGPLEEACSLDLVPTTSTTVFMALGDALAVTLLRRRGLTEEDFAYVHPGGLIGRFVARRVGEIMHAREAMPRVPDTATLRDALVEIMDKGLGVTTVVDARGDLAGILTDGDLKRIILGKDAGEALSSPVSQFMTARPRRVDPQALIATAVRRMEAREPGPVTCLVVAEGERPVGILHLHDCLGTGRGELPSGDLPPSAPAD